MVALTEARDHILPLILRDLEEAGLGDKFSNESPDEDPGKFLLDGKPARVIQHHSGYPLNINLDWFKGSIELALINQGPFYWYVFDLTIKNKGEACYFICPYSRLRSWVLEFDAPKGVDYRQQHNWGSNFRFPDTGTPWFRWDDEEIDNPVNKTRYVKLNNVVEALNEFGGSSVLKGYEEDGVLNGFTKPSPFSKAALSEVTNDPGVHVVWDSDANVIYVGHSKNQRRRILQHLSGDRIASILHKKVGEKLDGELGREATGEEIRGFLGKCFIAWKYKSDPEDLKELLLDSLNPVFSSRKGRNITSQKKIPITLDLTLAGYFLSRVGVSGPPSQLNVEKFDAPWEMAFARFYKSLGHGRSYQTFHDTLKVSVRDVFDAHLENDRRGWFIDGNPKKLSQIQKTLMGKWANKSDEELWETVSAFVDFDDANLLAIKAESDGSSVVEPKGKIWCICLGIDGSSNFRIGLDAGTWGFSSKPKASNFSPGDRVLFFHAISSSQAPPPRGFPRVDSVEKFCPGVAKHGVEAKVSNGLYQTQEALWPDDHYSFRFDFEVIGENHELAYSGELFGADLMEKMRMSLIANGRPYSVPDDGRILLTTGATEEVHDPYEQKHALADLFCEEEELQNYLNLLDTKRNLVLQGPPGVGKTYLARRLSWLLLGLKNDARVHFTQFHQSYAYEDFVRGFRPNEDGGFELKDGPFLEFCQAARDLPDENFVMIIDEINRGNLSRIFGELLMLIEKDKRDQSYAIKLSCPRSDTETFFVPENLYIIGTMNTADRSLALVDYALRRRFAFVRLRPMFTSGKFKEHLKESGVSEDWVDTVERKLASLNDKIKGDESNLGEGYEVGHSYFCDYKQEKYGSVGKWYSSVIKTEIQPLLEEYWFDDPKTVKAQVKDLEKNLPD